MNIGKQPPLQRREDVELMQERPREPIGAEGLPPREPRPPRRTDIEPRELEALVLSHESQVLDMMEGFRTVVTEMDTTNKMLASRTKRQAEVIYKLRRSQHDNRGQPQWRHASNYMWPQENRRRPVSSRSYTEHHQPRGYGGRQYGRRSPPAQYWRCSLGFFAGSGPHGRLVGRSHRLAGAALH